MFPHERSLVKKLTGKPFALIGVNGDADRNVPKTLAEEGKVTWRSFWNGPQGAFGPIASQWEVKGWPTIYLIDADGVIRHKGFLRGRELEIAIEQLLAELGHDVELSHDDVSADEADEG